MHPFNLLRFLPGFAFLLPAAIAAPPPAIQKLRQATVAEQLGVNIHFIDPEPGEVELLKMAGFGWVRQDLNWQRTEQRKGKYDFSMYLRMADALDAAGIKILFILDYGNPLYEEKGSVSSGATREAFARWAVAAVKTFQGRGYLWEIWNEPNHEGFWKAPPNAADYASLANTAGAALRRACPGEPVIGPATSGIPMEFLEDCFRAGTLEHWDAVSVHPYRLTGPETVTSEYASLRRLISKYTPHKPPVISGEWGYTAIDPGLSEDLQGEMLARQFLTNQENRIPLSIWYDWRNDGTDPREREHHFGTIGYWPAGAPVEEIRIKPAYRAAQTLLSAIGSHRFSKRLAIGGSEEHLLLFSHGEEAVVAAWTESAHMPTMVELPADLPEAQRTGCFGEKLGSLAPGAALSLTNQPVYLQFPKGHTALHKIPALPQVHLSLGSLPGGLQVAQLQNYEGEKLEGELVLRSGDRTERQSFCAESDSSVLVPFHMTTPAGPDDALSVSLFRSGKELLRLPRRRQVALSDDFYEHFILDSSGDSKTGGSQRFAVSRHGLPAAGHKLRWWKLNASFEKGWRFVILTPKSVLPIEGRPAAFGCWVHGDGSGMALRMQIKDAHDRTWQLQGAHVDWTGWRYVRFPLLDSLGHWGGQGEAKITPPLRWAFPLLVDNITGGPAKCELIFGTPILEYP